MARASTRTLLALDEFARILNIHTLHFNQVVYSLETDDRGMTCEMPLVQHSWMRADTTGREEIAEAIATAEQRMTQWLGFALAPSWRVVDVPGVKLGNPLLSSRGIGVRGYNHSFHTKTGHVISGGVEAKTVIEASAPVVYTDDDADGYAETATVTVATAVTDDEEIAIFYPGEAGDDSWEVRPLRSVVIAGGVAVIRVWRQQLLIKNLQQGFGEAATRAADAVTDTNFLAAVDVYRRYNDSSLQAQFIGVSMCGCGSCPYCTFSIQNGCFITRDTRLGIVMPTPAEWNAVTGEYDTGVCCMIQPDRVRLYLRSGFKSAKINRPLNNMDPDLARAVAYYAASMLERPLCACKALEAQIMYWRTDFDLIKSSQVGSSSYRRNNKALDNPLGTTRGAVNAWQIINKMRLGESSESVAHA